MSTRFSAAGGDVTAVLVEVMKAYHPALCEAEVNVGVLLAWNPEDAAVTNGGYPAAAKIKVVSLRDRIGKGYDAELLIDAAEWEQAQPARRAALIDHELSHLALVPGVGGCKRDALGRPKLKLRLGDWNGGDGFAAVVERHGAMAFEYTNAVGVKAAVDGAIRRHRGLFDDLPQAGG